MVAIAPEVDIRRFHRNTADMELFSDRLRTDLARTRVHVTGTPVASERRRFLEGAYTSAKLGCRYAAEKAGLTICHDPGEEYLELDPIEPGAGIVRGYTDSRRVRINPYIVAGTEMYRGLRDWMACKTGRFGIYLRDMFGTQESADDAARDTLNHEVAHKALQLNPIMNSDGKVAEPFRDALLKRLRQRYEEALPKGIRWLSPLLAYLKSTPIIEGLNEVAKGNIYSGKSAFRIQEEAEGGITSYDMYTSGVARFLDERYGHRRGNPGSEALALYGDYVSNGVGVLDELVNGVRFDHSGGYTSRRAAASMAMQMPVSVPYARAA